MDSHEVDDVYCSIGKIIYIYWYKAIIMDDLMERNKIFSSNRE